MALHTKILLGLVVGAVLGIVTNLLTDGAPATDRPRLAKRLDHGRDSIDRIDTVGWNCGVG